MRRIEWLIALLIIVIAAAAVIPLISNYQPATYCVFSPHNQKVQWHEVEIDRTHGATDVELKAHNGFPNGGRGTLHDAIVLPASACPAH